MPLANGVPSFTRPSRAAAFTVSAGGMLVYQSSTIGAQSRLVWKDRQGKDLANMGERTSRINGIGLSPDRKRLVANNGEHAGMTALWIYDSARGVRTRFTSDRESYSDAVWSRDGNSLFYSATHLGSTGLFRKSSGGIATEELLLNEAAEPTSMSPDGKLLLCTRSGGKTGSDLWIVPVPPEGGDKPAPKVFLATPYEEMQAQFSPDGRWIAYVSNESGQLEIYAVPFPGPGGKLRISSGGGILPLWRDDGREHIYVTNEGRLMAVETVARNGTLETGQAHNLFDGLITNRDRDMTYRNLYRRSEGAGGRRRKYDVLVPPDTAPELASGSKAVRATIRPVEEIPLTCRLKLEVQGHTDNVGADAYNQTLSEARAKAVAAWLTQHGVAADRLTAMGYGKTRPVADNGSDEGRAKNRRVEIADPRCSPKAN